MGKFLRSEKVVRADFPIDGFLRHDRRTEPWRCALCNRMKLGTDDAFYVASSSVYFRDEDYDSLVIGGRSSSRTGACMDCLRMRH